MCDGNTKASRATLAPLICSQITTNSRVSNCVCRVEPLSIGSFLASLSPLCNGYPYGFPVASANALDKIREVVVIPRESPDLTNLPSCTIPIGSRVDWIQIRVENALIIDRVQDRNGPQRVISVSVFDDSFAGQPGSVLSGIGGSNHLQRLRRLPDASPAHQSRCLSDILRRAAARGLCADTFHQESGNRRQAVCVQGQRRHCPLVHTMDGSPGSHPVDVHHHPHVGFLVSLQIRQERCFGCQR